MSSSETCRPPPAAVWLTAAGVIPFAALAGGLVLDLQNLPLTVAEMHLALRGYGAVILSFLGGILWGMTIVSGRPAPERAGGLLVLSTVPPLFGWAALLLPAESGLLLLIACFPAMLAVDWRTAAAGIAPAWYPKLRAPVTVAVVICLGAVWLF